MSLSSFLVRGHSTAVDSLALLHLKRDLQVPVVLCNEDGENDGYIEGKVTNTRFGSFPHSTLVDVPWGSQVRASAVDTGSRGRKWPGERGSNKRKRNDEGSEHQSGRPTNSSPQSASTGFVHILPPTPENWAMSLPHRTQVVYTSDYSYVLQRLRVKPGSAIIEAGAGSGSFTHAAARAVYDGTKGQVWSFEFHEQRADKLIAELADHGLSDIVRVTHRDVCDQGFAVHDLVKADAIFLDLPAPWQALKHLTRCGPLNEHRAVHLCTFSPCIEQVHRTVIAMRELGWVELEMVEIAARRVEVRRDRVSLQEEGLRGVNASANSVDEAILRLRDNERRTESFFSENKQEINSGPVSFDNAKPARKLYREGLLIHRTESELKTHTSYLVFGVLPQEWHDIHEDVASQRIIDGVSQIKSKRQLKREMKNTKV